VRATAWHFSIEMTNVNIVMKGTIWDVRRCHAEVSVLLMSACPSVYHTHLGLVSEGLVELREPELLRPAGVLLFKLAVLHRLRVASLREVKVHRNL
jgi:hypothetical protein